MGSVEIMMSNWHRLIALDASIQQHISEFCFGFALDSLLQASVNVSSRRALRHHLQLMLCFSMLRGLCSLQQTHETGTMAEPFEKVSCRKHGEVVLSSNQVPETNKTAAKGRPLSMAEFHLSLLVDNIFQMIWWVEKFAVLALTRAFFNIIIARYHTVTGGLN